jgi:hypothetical protein
LPSWPRIVYTERPLFSVHDCLCRLRADGQPGMFGYLGGNPLADPGRNNWDMALLKDFELPWFGPELSSL